MTSGRIQPFCKNYNINVGCFDGTRINQRNITSKNISLLLYSKHFCLIWKSNGTSFNEAVEEFNLNFEVIDVVISDKSVEIFIECHYKPK